MYDWIRNAFTTLTMFDFPYPVRILELLPVYPVTTACKYLSEASDKHAGLGKATCKSCQRNYAV